jgi:3-dehydroquinate synthase
MKRIQAHLPSRDYDILVGKRCLTELGEALVERRRGGQVVVCCDENVAPLYLEGVAASLRATGLSVSHVVIPAGEREKNLARAEELYGIVYDRGVRRGDTLIALGGGVIGDLIGFVAATYQRGVGLIQVPTTLLAQVDASVGGKVAVDFRAGKNYVGTFYQPHLVFVDAATLATLPQRELRSGAAEVAKYGMLAGGQLLDRVEGLARDGVADERVGIELLSGCVEHKVAVVSVDEREETGERAMLNLGHTIGHAVEAATGFVRFSHGEAVGLGLHAALRMSARVSGLAPDDELRGHALLDGLGLPQSLEGVTADEVCALVGRDKKATDGGVGYVLLAGLGEPRVNVHVPFQLQHEVVEWLIAR